MKAELRRRPTLRNRPVIITAGSSQGHLVLDASPQATDVVAGMPLQEALSRCKGATLLEADEPHYRLVFDRMVRRLLQRSPVVEKGGLGCAYVGVAGLEAMYGGEARVVAALLNAVPTEFKVRVGLADTKFPAYVAAIIGDGGHAVRVPDDVAGFLADLPVDLLPVSWDNKVRLRRFGLHTIGQVASLPVSSVQAQFGPEGKTAWELANGIDPSPLLPYRREEDGQRVPCLPLARHRLARRPSGHRDTAGPGLRQPRSQGQVRALGLHRGQCPAQGPLVKRVRF